MTDATQYLLVVARLTASTDEPVGSGPVGDVLSLDDPHAEAFELAGSVGPLVTDRLATTVLDPSEGKSTASENGGSND